MRNGSEIPEMQERNGRAWRWCKMLAAPVVLAIALWHADLTSFAAMIEPRSLLGMAGASLIILSSLWLIALRHALLVSRPRAPLLPSFKSVVLSAGLNLFVPGRLAEIVKATYLREKIGIRLSQGLTALVIERLFDVLTLGALAAVVTASSVFDLNYVLPAAALTLGASLFAAPFVTRAAAPQLAARTGRVARFLHEAITHYEAVAYAGRLPLLAGLTLAIWSLNLAACVVFLLVQPFAEVSFWHACLVFVAVNLAVAIPGPPAVGGLFQVAVGLVLLPLGMPLDTVIVLGVALQLALSTAILVLFLPIMIFESTGVIGLVRDARRTLVAGGG